MLNTDAARDCFVGTYGTLQTRINLTAQLGRSCRLHFEAYNLLLATSLKCSWWYCGSLECRSKWPAKEAKTDLLSSNIPKQSSWGPKLHLSKYSKVNERERVRGKTVAPSHFLLHNRKSTQDKESALKGWTQQMHWPIDVYLFVGVYVVFSLRYVKN